MKIIAKFDVLYYNGERDVIFTEINNNIENKCENFTLNVNYKNGKIPLVFKKTITEIADDYISDDFDKAIFMENNNVNIIYNWDIISVNDNDVKLPIFIDNKKGYVLNVIDNDLDKNKIIIDSVLDLLSKNSSHVSQRIVDDFKVVYLSMFDNIKNLPKYKQIKIVLDALNVAYKSSKNTLDELSKNTKQKFIDYKQKIE